MTRTRYHDYRSPDSTLALNNRFRPVIQAGVYLGYTVSLGGSSGLWLRFTHETDPDDSTKILGAIRTPDGVVVTEDANQDDVVQGSLSAGTPNIHYVVASYIYNQALPNNDVTYSVKQGTSGSPPTPPTLTDNEVLLAEIDVPSGATGYNSSGVDIKTVAKKDAFDINDYNFWSKFDEILDSGIYEGIEMSEGSSDLDIDLSAGTWITKESARIVESSDQSDLFTMTNPGTDKYKLSWIIGLHKNEDLDPQPDVDYLLVEGTAVSLGSEASLPSDSAIEAAAVAVDAKYDDISYANKLGYIRLENRSSVYYSFYSKGETVLQQDSITVYSGESVAFSRSGKYFGHDGLQQAITDIYAVDKDNVKQPYVIKIDGNIHLADQYLEIPSHVKLVGLGAPSKISSDEGADGVLSCLGFNATWDTSNNTVAQSAWGGGSPPSGYVARTFAVQSTYWSGHDLVDRLFSTGDRIRVYSDSSGNYYDAEFREYDTSTDNWTIRIYIEEEYNVPDGNPLDLDLTIWKQDVHLHNLEIDNRTSTGSGVLKLDYVEHSSFNDLRIDYALFSNILDSKFGEIELNDGSSSTFTSLQRVILDYLKISGVVASDISLEFIDSTINSIELSNEDSTSDLIVDLDNCNVNKINLVDASSSELYIKGNHSFISFIGSENKLWFDDAGFFLCGMVKCLDDLEIKSNSSEVILSYLEIPDANTFTNSGGNKSYVLQAVASYDDDNFLGINEYPHSDKNLKLVSDANFSWSSTTGILSWDDVLTFDLPWTTGYNEIAVGGATLSTDGDRLYVDIDRTSTGTDSVSVVVRNKALANNDAFYKNRFFIALRDGDVVYLYDGTRVEDGQTIRLGQTASQTIDVYNNFYRDYVVVDDNVGFDNQVVVMLDGIITYSYATSTGVVQYSDTVDLSNVQIGDFIILRDVNYNPGTTGAYTFEEILDFDNVSDTVTIAKGLDFSFVSAHRWNGAVCRGNKVCSNYNQVTFSYDADGTNPGRITYSAGLGFSSNQVRVGYIFIDSAGEKHLIIDRDATGNGDWVTIRPDSKTVDTSTPTSVNHGSIELNNNPRNLPMADLKTLYGAEFVPIQGLGKEDNNDDRLLNRINSVVDNAPYRSYFSVPYDPRVRLLAYSSISKVNLSVVTPEEDIAKYKCYEPHHGGYYVEITAFCSGIIIVSNTADVINNAPIYLDGEELSTALFKGDFEADNSYAAVVNRHELLVTNQDGTSDSQLFTRLFRLPTGIHNIIVNNGFEPFITGFYVIHHPHRDDKNLVCYENPGKAIREGDLISYSQALNVSIPSSTESIDKGGKVLRYIDNDGIRKWATNYVPGYSSTGTFNGTTTVTSVSNINQWNVGDIILIINLGTTTKYLRVISAVDRSGSILTLDSNAPVSTTQSFYYYGRCLAGSTGVSGLVGSTDRPNETVAESFKLLDFCKPGLLSSQRSAVSDTSGFVAARTLGIGVRLNDGLTGIQSTEAATFYSTNGYYSIEFEGTGNYIIITFVGTGLSIGIQSDVTGGPVTVTLDGYTILASLYDPTYFDRNGELFVCSELPYCQHVLKIKTTAFVTQLIFHSFTVYQPSKPSFPSSDVPVLEITETNLLSEFEVDLSASPAEDGILSNIIGTLNYDAYSLVNSRGGSSNAIRDDFKDNAETVALTSQTVDWQAAGGDSSDARVAFGFFGYAFTIVTDNINVNSNQINVKVLAHDGVWKAPSSSESLLGFTVVVTVGSTDYWSANDATDGKRKTWIFSTLAFHSIRFEGVVSGQDLSISSVEIACPYHIHRTIVPVSLDRWLPFQNAGVDKRNLVPFRSDELHNANVPIIQGMATEIDSTDPSSWKDVNPFIFYTNGGLTKIDVSATVDSAGAVIDTNIHMYIDGVYMEDFYTTLSVASTQNIAFSLVVNLKQGYHFAYITTLSSVSENIGNIKWSITNFSGGVNALVSRSNGVPALGSGDPNESTY
jgi:hypothetical protein